MKNLKKCLAFVLAIAFAVSTIPASAAFAAGESEATTISVESKSVQAGETVAVDVSIKNNPGITGGTLQIAYDKGLTLVSAESGTVFSYMKMTPSKTLDSPCKFLWYADNCPEENKVDGVILTLTFEVSKDVALETNLNVNVTAPLMDFTDNDLKEVNVVTKDGTISISDHNYGAWIVTKNTTCTEDGSRERVCSDCSDKQVEVIPATGHTEVVDEAVAVTCTTDGKTEGSHCSTCQKVIKVQEVVLATGHIYENGTCTVCGTEEPQGLMGDVNGDGSVDTSDAQAIFNHFMGIAELPSDMLAFADINGDDSIDTSDAQAAFNIFMGIM